MLQVTFRDVLPSVEVVAQISATHSLVRALADGRLDDGACLSVTLTQLGQPERARHEVLIELIRPERATIVAITESHSVDAALRSGLSLAQASRPAPREDTHAPAAPAHHQAHGSAWAVGA